MVQWMWADSNWRDACVYYRSTMLGEWSVCEQSTAREGTQTNILRPLPITYSHKKCMNMNECWVRTSTHTFTHWPLYWPWPCHIDLLSIDVDAYIRYFGMAQVSADNSSWHTFAHHERNTNEFVKQTFLHDSLAFKFCTEWATGGRTRVPHTLSLECFRLQQFVEWNRNRRRRRWRLKWWIYVMLFRLFDAFLSIFSIHFNW